MTKFDKYLKPKANEPTSYHSVEHQKLMLPILHKSREL
jgi:hypothetical protein